MLYEKYERRILRIAALKKWAKRYRAVLITSAAVAMILLLGFMSLKGVVYSTGEIPSVITYGDSLPYSANAIFGGVAYEYASKDGDVWSKEQPKRAGEYKVRAVSKRIFGSASYSKARHYKIVPKPLDVTVTQKAVIYGENPQVSAELMYGDTISCTAFSYADVSEASTTVTPDKNSIVIKDISGADVTESYDITPAPSGITLEKRAVTVTVGSAEKTYDGLPLTFTTDDGTPLAFAGYEISAGTLASGDTLFATFVSSQTDAGETENTVSLTVTRGDGTDVTGRYDLETVSGTLRVNKRTVFIVTQSAEKEYDGTPLTSSAVAPGNDTPLAAGHSLGLVTPVSLTNAGTIANLPTVRVMSGDADVTDNYSLVFGQESLTVRQRAVTVRTDSATKVYDGTPLQSGVYAATEAGRILLGHTLSAVLSGAQTQAGSGANTVGSIGVTSGAEDVTANYSFDYELGLLTVTPRPIKVYTASKTLVYNGDYRTCGDVTFGDTELAFGDAAFAVSLTQTALKNVGTAKNVFSIEIKNSAGENVTDSYSIASYEYGDLEIIKCRITVTTATADFVYNGASQSDASHTVEPLINARHTSKSAGNVIALTDVEREGQGFKEYENDFIIEIFDGGEEVTANYDITYEYGLLKMLPMEITVTTATNTTLVYNGENQSDTSFTLSPKAVSGHTVTAIGSISAVCEVEYGDEGLLRVKNEFDVVIMSGATDVTHNYNIRFIHGYLVMNPRKIVVTTNTREWVYNAETHSDTGHTTPHGALVSGHTTQQIGYFNSIRDVIRLGDGIGSIENFFLVDIFDGERRVSRNYEIDYVYGTLKILPREITVTTQSRVFTYSGKMQFDVEFSVTKGEIVESQLAVYAGGIGITDVIRLENGGIGSIANELYVQIRDGYYIYYTSNYDVTYNYGSLKMMPLEITVTTRSNEWMYDGQPHHEKGFDRTNGIPAANQRLVLDSNNDYVTITNVIRLEENGVEIGIGSIENKFKVLVFTTAYPEGDVDVTHNYDITYIYGTLKVTPRPITVSPSYTSKEYDGFSLIPSDYISVRSYIGLVDGHGIEGTLGGSQTEIGTSESYISFVRIFSEKGNETYNYDITLEKGVLEVYLIYCGVYSGDAYKIYDGEPLRCDEYDIFVNLLPGHILTVTSITGEQTEIGRSDNYITVKITHNGVDVSDIYYRIYYNYGTLQVAERIITIKTHSAEKPYDGTPLRCEEYDATGELFEGHTIETLWWSQITEVGSINNLVLVRLKDNGGNYVHFSYIMLLEYGTLTITGESGSSELDLSGGISGNPGGGAGASGSQPVFYATSTTSGTVYFRAKSFGDYTGKAWSAAKPYITDSGINGLQLSYYALNKAGKPVSNVLIEPVSKNLVYLLPYYAADGYYGSNNDVQINMVIGGAYGINYLPYEYKAGDIPSLAGTHYEEFEREYYEYVLKNYLKLPDSTRSQLLEIAAKNNLKAGSPTLIQDVTTFVKNKVRYDRDFNEYKDDYAVFFFTEAKTGICQHYATAATAMLRALGIPARYTGGFVAEMSAGQVVAVNETQAHAWVEVYLPGAGWVQIEVTGAGAGSGAGGGGIGGGTGGGTIGEDGELIGGEGDGAPPVLAIKPVDVYKMWDGTPLTPDEIIEGDNYITIVLLERLLAEGYYYHVGVSGSRIDYGVSQSNITGFTLYDSYGKNVTNSFEFAYKPGRIRITYKPIIINLYSLQKYYDGKPLEYKSSDYWVDTLPQGASLKFNLVGSLTDVGVLRLSDFEELPFTLYDEYGNDITSNYSLVFVGDPLRVDRRSIEITSASSSKSYDGTPLTNGNNRISKGSLPDGYSYEAIITGTITDIGAEKNTIQSVRIYDKDNKNVTKNFQVTVKFGKLTII